MSVERVERQDGEVVYRVRWRDHQGRNRARVLGRRRDALAFEAEVKRRKRMGELAAMDAGRETLDQYVTGSWANAHATHLAPRTRRTYASSYDRHIAPRLGDVPLREFDAELVATFQGELLRAGVGAHAIRKAMTLLGALLQRAAEGGRIPYNPQRVVRKARLPLAQEVRPFAPRTIEAMRAAGNLREAVILSVLGYAGLRPGELRTLRWGHVRDRTLLINAGKTGRRRTVRLLAPLAVDLAGWRRAEGRPGDDALVFPGDDGAEWSANGFEKWRQRRFSALLAAAGLQDGRPYDLRHSFASLLLHEGRDVIYVARQLGHGADMTLGTYGHVIEELEDTPQLPAEEAIRQGREAIVGGDVYPFRTSQLALEGAANSETPANPARPDQDSNLGPTP